MQQYAAALVAATLSVLSCATPQGAGPADRATEIADRVMESLGGADRWNALRGLRWSFGSQVGDSLRSLRRHAWDKHAGWHRVEGTNRQGQSFVFIENLNDSTAGMAWMDGQPIEGDSLRALMRIAKRYWTNDTYWMLMPYKLRDPGVRLAYEGRAPAAGAEYEKVALSFDGVGQTPGDRYWIYVNPTTHRIERWDYLLEGDAPPAQSTTWEGWEEHDGLWFPTAHRRDRLNVFIRDVETVAEFRPHEFRAP